MLCFLEYGGWVGDEIECECYEDCFEVLVDERDCFVDGIGDQDVVLVCEYQCIMGWIEFELYVEQVGEMFCIDIDF